MRMAVISFTASGAALNQRIGGIAQQLGWEYEGWQTGARGQRDGLRKVEGTVPKWAADCWKLEVICFVGAAGIAVRSIAGSVKDKLEDPAVLCVSEDGAYVIPLLSGHVGGANEAAQILADKLGAKAVITTATDIRQCFAVDVFARRNNLTISDRQLAKEISAAILDGEVVGFRIDPCLMAEAELSAAHLPGELNTDRPERLNVHVTCCRGPKTEDTLYLIPRRIILGIGCRKGTDKTDIMNFINSIISEHGWSANAICKAATIDLKKQENGLLEAMAELQIPLQFYSAEALNRAEGSFTGSGFVARVTGTDNVCERAAVCAGGKPELLLHKTAGNGITLAAAIEDGGFYFE